MRAWGVALGGAVASWRVVNLPVMAFATDGWAKFYTFSQERGVDYGSFWLIISQRAGITISGANSYATALMLLLCAGIAVLALYAPRRPRFAQLAFLVIAVFILTNKVYSPQYVLWLLPLAVLARPRFRDQVIWQATEVFYFASVWWYLGNFLAPGDGGDAEFYWFAILLWMAAELYLVAVVVRDIWWPRHDPVRTKLPFAGRAVRPATAERVDTR
jgi:uncharacterized membrane protein